MAPTPLSIAIAMHIIKRAAKIDPRRFNKMENAKPKPITPITRQFEMTG